MLRLRILHLRNKKVESCIIGRIRGWRFKPIDKAEGDVTVRQKYIFGKNYNWIQLFLKATI